MKTMHIFIAIGGAGILIIAYLVISSFLGVTRTVNETKMLATYSCGAAELRLMHMVSDSFDHQKETLYFEFQKEGTTTTTKGVGLTSDGWQLTGPSPYYSLADIRTFSGFTPDYAKERAWNEFVGADVDHALFSEIADCVESHRQDINGKLESFTPSISSFKNTERLSALNSISSNKGNIEFACGDKNSQDKIYRVTMSGSPHAYKPKIEMYDLDTYSSDYERYPSGFWLITAPAPKGSATDINDLRSCTNSEGGKFGTYFDTFNAFATKIGFSDTQNSRVH
ncbi:hypothetical protein BH11PAT2_BH11PAT2_06170 [soil metagenome]